MEAAADGAATGEHDTSSAVAAFAAGRIVEAADMIRSVLRRRPDDAGASHLYGLVLQAQGETERAASALEDAVRLGETAVRRSHLGKTLVRLGRHVEAMANHERALALDPDGPEVLNDLGQSLLALKRYEAAAEALGRATARRPDFAEAWIGLGYAFQALGRDAEGREAHEAALEADLPADAPGRATALLSVGRLDEAEAAGRRSVERWPGDPAAHAALAAALRARDDLAGAEAAARRVLAFRPDDVVALNNLAVLLQERGRLAEALAVLDRSEAIEPEDPETRHTKSLALLLLGRWAEAWPLHEARLRIGQARGSHELFADGQAWRGEPALGRTVLVAPEQGAGDMMQFVRYVPLLAARGARVVLATYPSLRRLFASVPGVERLVTTADPRPAHDLHCWMMSLPGLFGAAPGAVPAAVPYLQVEPALSARWRARVGTGVPGPRVGIAWAGNPAHLNDRRRSIAFAALAPLWSVPGLRWFSLQVGPRAADLAAAPVAVDDLAPGLDDFADTAAAIGALDLVVTVDTAVAHLAGALGKPVWVMLPAQVDWRWGTAGTATPWYPTMRLFRRGQDEGWSPAVEAVARALRARAAPARGDRAADPTAR